MSWDSFESTLGCVLCKTTFTVRDVRKSQLCPSCNAVKYDIDAVLNGKSASLATDEDKQRIVDRLKTNHTVRSGSFRPSK